MELRLQSNKRRDEFNYNAVTILMSALSVKISYFRGFINYHGARRQNLRGTKTGGMQIARLSRLCKYASRIYSAINCS